MQKPQFFKDVTLLITHYNRSSSLERLLKSCRDQGYNFEHIVVSDDCSSQEHQKRLDELQTQYNFEIIRTTKNGGLGNNINKGQAAVTTAFTLYVQEDFVPLETFGQHFEDGIELLRKRADLDIVRFYAYLRYPHMKDCEKGFCEMEYRPWSLKYKKIYMYSDHPHLRRSNFIQKFGPYSEGVSVDRSEYRMCISFIQQKGKGVFFNEFQSLFLQINPDYEPSTTPRSLLTMSSNPFIKLPRDMYRQIRYNYDLRFLDVNYGFAKYSKFPDHDRIHGKTGFLESIVDKALSALVKIRHPKAGNEYRKFYKDTYYCQLHQLKFLVKDYLIKRPYKVVSFNGEFAPELQFALPHAYWHYLNGTLRTTISSAYSAELYFFSRQHLENDLGRTNDGNYNFDIPRILYSQNYNISKWAQVPLKEFYKNEIYKFEKPPIVIANRYNMEWGAPPISFFSIENLERMISVLKSSYTIIYNRPGAANITTDDSEIYDLHEIEWLKMTHPEVILMDDLFAENRGKANNFNHLQLLVYANCSNFISTHGGTATLASYFEGTNVILSRQGPEHHFECYRKLYPKLSGTKILHAKNDSELETHIMQQFVGI